MSHTGIFNAKITFTQPVNVTWLINNTEIELGTMNLTPLSAKSKRATIDQNVLFEIADEDAFGTFTEAMITQSNFTWRLKSNGLRVNALKFPVATGIQFDKKVTLNGINSFDGNVKLVEFQVRTVTWKRRCLCLLMILSRCRVTLQMVLVSTTSLRRS